MLRKYAGLIDKEGKIILPANKYNSIGDFNEKQQAKAIIEYGINQNEYLIDITGKVIK